MYNDNFQKNHLKYIYPKNIYKYININSKFYFKKCNHCDINRRQKRNWQKSKGKIMMRM